MDDWKIGDVAICINIASLDPTGYPPLLKLYGDYIINDIHICKCGEVSFDVGLVSKNGQCTECACSKIIPDNTIHWCLAKRFVKKQTKQMLQMELNAAVIAEDYRLAAVLDKQLKEM